MNEYQNVKRILWLAVASLALAALACADAPPTPYNDFPSPPPDFLTQSEPSVPGGETASVVEIIDGDTIDVTMNGEIYRVRYIGVNTPERGEPCYQEATAANTNLVYQQTVTLVRDVSETDRYDRLLRYIYVGGTFVNAVLVEQGWAEAKDYPPDSAQADTFDSLEASAYEQSLGCWGFGVFER